MRLIKSKKKISEEFSLIFDKELHDWLIEEMKLNKQKPISLEQKCFWKAPSKPGEHDPRGCPSYVKNYIDPFLTNFSKEPMNVHKPHPNIVDELRGVCKEVSRDTESCKSVSTPDYESDSEDTISNKFEAITISEEFSIPVDAKPLI